jgi:hypothetical protein
MTFVILAWARHDSKPIALGLPLNLNEINVVNGNASALSVILCSGLITPPTEPCAREFQRRMLHRRNPPIDSVMSLARYRRRWPIPFGASQSWTMKDPTRCRHRVLGKPHLTPWHAPVRSAFRFRAIRVRSKRLHGTRARSGAGGRIEPPSSSGCGTAWNVAAQ